MQACERLYRELDGGRARRALRRPRRASRRQIRDRRSHRHAVAGRHRPEGPGRRQGGAEAPRRRASARVLPLERRRRAPDRRRSAHEPERDDEGKTAPTGTRPFSPLRVDARRALSAHAPARGLRLGHRRLLVPRHHARRRDADRRAVGHERFPQGAARQDRRHQRPYLRRAASTAR